MTANTYKPGQITALYARLSQEDTLEGDSNSIVAILERMDNCGHTVNFKSYSKSHKLKKRIPTTKEQQAIFFNTHEAIVEDAVLERVQELRANKRRPTKAERQGLFSGLVYCADCGSKLHFAICKSWGRRTRPLPLCKVQEQYGKLYSSFYPRRSIEADSMEQDI